MSILTFEQNTKFAFKISSRGCILDKGRVLFKGKVEELNSKKKAEYGKLLLKIKETQ